MTKITDNPNCVDKVDNLLKERDSGEHGKLGRVAKMFRVHFDGCDFWLPIKNDDDDQELKDARRIAESRMGKDLWENPRTGFPSFTIYEITEVGGG